MTEPNPFTLQRAQATLDRMRATWHAEFPGSPLMTLAWLDPQNAGQAIVFGDVHPSIVLHALAAAWHTEREQLVAALEQARGPQR